MMKHATRRGAHVTSASPSLLKMLALVAVLHHSFCFATLKVES